MKPLLFACMALILVALPAAVRGQSAAPDVERYVAMVNSGQVDEVRSELPSLLSKYPNNPGVLYVQALVTTEGSDAVRIYQSIVDNYPQSEWADAALYRVYQFYYALGLYRTAELKMNQLKKEYPQSKYLKEGEEPDTRNLPEEPVASAPALPTSRPPAANATPSPKTTSSSLRVQYVLQVGAYTAQANAERQKRFFETLGYPVEIISKAKGNRPLFLVWLGNFASYDEAKAESAKIREKHNIGSIVISK